MKKNTNLKKIALFALTGGILMAQTQANAAQNNQYYRGNQSYTADATDASMNSSMQKSSNHMMSEQDLLSQLSPEGKATFQGLSPEGKALALKLANQSCKGQNECKGMNSCKSNENSCAGQGGCKGTSKGPFTDKNVAVKVAAKKMAEKRSMMMNNNGNG